MAKRRKAPIAKMTNQRMVRILLDEMADIRKELKEDLGGVKKELKADLHTLDGKLSGRIDSLAGDVKALRSELHQNQSALLHNLSDIDQRVTVLERAA